MSARSDAATRSGTTASGDGTIDDVPLTADLDRNAVNLIRGFAMDAPLAAHSGHQGTAMTLAPLAHVLFSRVLRYDPANPEWPDRDRFILSNGHASILQYSELYLAGMGLELDDIKAFRSWESLTPGHPEADITPGIEVTTGPLGQGFANAVGMAMAEQHLRERFGAELIDHRTFVIAGDGCFMEGVSHEAASLAGHLGLDHLVCIYDDNHVTIDGHTELAYSDDVAMRFAAYGWNVVRLGEIGEDLDALERALVAATEVTDQPTLLILRTHIGVPSPDLTDDPAAHGNPFRAEQVSRTKQAMGIPDEPFWAPAEVVDAYRAHCAERGAAWHAAWRERLAASKVDREVWAACWDESGTAGWQALLPTFDAGEQIATRVAVERAFNAIVPQLPGLMIGAADLTGNTGTRLHDAASLSRTDRGGRQVHYGVREHGMAAAMVGMARHGGVIPAGGTFFVFVDYMRPSVRLAVLSHAKVIFVFTHDSVGVGEDGPTHQPVEHLATLRAMPDLQVIRPADANETAQAVRVAIEHDGPTALVLSRQNIRVCTDGSAVERGGGIVRAVDDPRVVLVGTGSEVALCVDAAERLDERGVAASVVSLPSWDRFARQDRAWREAILPPGVPVLSVEAATTFGWERYASASIGIDRFGASAPGAVVMDKLGINIDNVVERALALVDGTMEDAS